MEKEGNNQVLSRDSVESLQHILERQQQRLVIYTEAREVGESLIAFFEALAQDQDEPQEINITKVDNGRQRK